MRRITTTLAMSAVFVILAHGQGFQNLNFESAQNLPGNPPELGSSVAITNALPDWTAFSGLNVLADVFYVSNQITGYTASVGLEGGSLALSGNFSIALFDGGSISQTGLVPAGAESLQFEAQGPGPGGSVVAATGFVITLGGQSLSFSALSDSPGYVEYGASIPVGMEGQVEALDFYCGGSVVLDNIEFSSMSVPEPSEYALLGLGAILLALRRLRKAPGPGTPQNP